MQLLKFAVIPVTIVSSCNFNYVYVGLKLFT